MGWEFLSSFGIGGGKQGYFSSALPLSGDDGGFTDLTIFDSYCYDLFAQFWRESNGSVLKGGHAQSVNQSGGVGGER